MGGETYERLNKCYMELDRASKTVMKMHERACAVEQRSSRFDARVGDLFEALQASEVVLSEISFGLKFKRDKSGTALTMARAQEMMKKASDSMTDLIDCNKALRAMMPKTAGEA